METTFQMSSIWISNVHIKKITRTEGAWLLLLLFVSFVFTIFFSVPLGFFLKFKIKIESDVPFGFYLAFTQK